MRLVTGLLPNPYSAYLRVYEPLVAFAPEQRATWSAYAEQAASRLERLRREHRRALADLLSVPPVAVPVDESSDAFVLEEDGQVFVCPLQSRLRAWLAFGEFRDGLPDATVPESKLVRLTLPTFAGTAEMAATSRLWGGYHIRTDNDEGLILGRNIATYSWPKYQAFFEGTSPKPPPAPR